MTTVEKIVRSFKRDYEVCKEPEWFQRWAERNSVLLGVVSDAEAKVLLNNYGISTEKDDDYAEYKIADLDKFEAAIA